MTEATMTLDEAIALVSGAKKAMAEGREVPMMAQAAAVLMAEHERSKMEIEALQTEIGFATMRANEDRDEWKAKAEEWRSTSFQMFVSSLEVAEASDKLKARAEAAEAALKEAQEQEPCAFWWSGPDGKDNGGPYRGKPSDVAIDKARNSGCSPVLLYARPVPANYVEFDVIKTAPAVAAHAVLDDMAEKWKSAWEHERRKFEHEFRLNQMRFSEMLFAQAGLDLAMHWAKNPELIAALRIPNERRLPEGAVGEYAQGWNDCRREMVEHALLQSTGEKK